MAIVYFFEIFFSDKLAQNFCLLVLLSMLLFNVDKFSKTTNKITSSWNSKNKESDKKKSNPVIAGQQKIVGVGIS